MADIKQLEKEVSSLQEKLRQQNAEAARIRQNLIDENKKNLKKYKDDMSRAVREHDKEAQKKYERLLANYQKNLNKELQFELEKMNADYCQLLSYAKRTEEELSRKNAELEKAIEEIRKDINKRNEGSGAEAKEYLKNAVSVFRSIEVKPHEKFTPKRLRIFFNAIKDGEQLYKAGMYEAATAVAISARSGLVRLGYTIDDKKEEWDNQYELFSMKLEYLQQKVLQELTDWEDFIDCPSNGNSEKKKQRLIEINYWSRGDFETVFKGAKKYQYVVSRIRELGKEGYLKQPDSANTDDLKGYIEDIEKLDKLLSESREAYKRRYTASCQRADWGEAIIDFLSDEINLIWCEELTGYKEAAEEERKKKEFSEYVNSQFEDPNISEDPREWLKLVFENASENRIYIYIIPVEKNGSVSNRVMMHIDYGGPEQEMYSRDIYQHVCEAIQYTEDDDIVHYTKDIEELKLSGNKVYAETGKDIERSKKMSKK